MKDEMCNKVVTTPLTDEQVLNAIVLHHVNILTLPIAKIKPYMPLSKGYRVKYLLSILMSVKGLKRAVTKAILINDLSYHGPSLIKSVDYLFKVGYLAKRGKPRLIVPFQKYKIDTGYVITEKGNEVLRKILLGR